MTDLGTVDVSTVHELRAGELKGLNGIDAPYEAPENPDLAFDTTDADTEELAARILALLAEHE